MFEGLKKKFSSFIESIAKKEEAEVRHEERREEAHSEGGTAVAAAPMGSEPVPHINGSAAQEASSVSAAPIEPEPQQGSEKAAPKAERSDARPAHAHTDGTRQEDTKRRVERPAESGAVSWPWPAESPVQADASEIAVVRSGPAVAQDEKRARHAEPRVERQLEQRVTLGTRLKGMVFREVRVSHDDVEPFMEQLRMALLQSDVNYEVVEKMLGSIESRLTAGPIAAKDMQANITGIIRESILSVLNKGGGVDLMALAAEKRGTGEPFKVLFLGPNGAGKTTAMAKVARLFMDNGFTCVLSASDTFRAAAIEQTVHHAERLGIRAIKGAYGADPASVAFDAIAHARAHGIDVVLIDSAGRQETNRSLMEEVRKMVRVAKPDMKIFVGESITGNALLGQVREFDQAVKLDGIILTKLDADAKGGNTISILSETEIPVLFFGTGEAYDAMVAYRPELILDNILPNN